MSHRTSGLTFIAIGAFLYAMRYLAAAIYISGTPVLPVSGNDRLVGLATSGSDVILQRQQFNDALESLGPQLGVLALVSFVIGCWLVAPLKESQTLKGQRREQEEEG